VLPVAAILLASRMAIVAAIVVSVSVVVARSGPVVGAMLATLPVSTGPAYVFLALDHGADFVVQGTVASLIGVASTAIFVLGHNLAARTGAGALPCLLAAATGCIGSMALADLLTWTLPGAVAASAAVTLGAIVATTPARRAARPFALPKRWIDLAVRAVAVMGVVGMVTVAAELSGPRLAGYGAMMPVVFMSFVIVVQPRVGGRVLSGLLAHALFGIAGFIPSLLIVNLGTRWLGVWWGLLLGLATAFAWNGAMVLLRRPGRTATIDASRPNVGSR
jgi:hypothetical protein